MKLTKTEIKLLEMAKKTKIGCFSIVAGHKYGRSFGMREANAAKNLAEKKLAIHHNSKNGYEYGAFDGKTTWVEVNYVLTDLGKEIISKF